MASEDREMLWSDKLGITACFGVLFMFIVWLAIEVSRRFDRIEKHLGLPKWSETAKPSAGEGR